jgi:hypothetical protein
MQPSLQFPRKVSKTNLHAPKTDAAFWRSQPYIQRLTALEQIRQEFHQWKYSAQPRLQRVYTVLKR